MGRINIKFPHATSEEREALLKFIESGKIHGIWTFELRLPSRKAKLSVELPMPIQQMWEKLTAKRIDAVCYANDAIYLIEVKRYLLPSGIGQLLVYAYMYNEIYKPDKPVKLYYVAYYNDPDVEHVCKQMGIKVFTVVDPFK